MEEYIDLCHYKTQEKVTVPSKKIGSKGEYLARCINPAHPDVHPSMMINPSKGVYNCLVCIEAKGVTWKRHLEERGSSKSYKQNSSKKYLQEKEENEIRSNILMAIDTDLSNWSGYDPEIKEEVRTRIPYDLCFLPESERTIAMGAIAKAGILRSSELKGRINKVKNMLEKQKESVKKEDKGNLKAKVKKEKKERVRTLIPGMIHLVKEGEQIGYLLQNSGQFYIEEVYNAEDGTVCRPKKDLPIYYCGIDILEEPREIDYKDLLKEVIDFIKSYLELPKESDYLILALWIFHTYIIEKFEATPILYFQGVKETGKTRAGEVLGALAYKCERLTSPTEATLFRSADYFKTALVIDEIQLWGKNGNEEVARLIKSRYKRGLKVNRINLNKKGEDQVEYFDVFAPLVISTTEPIPDIIESRCISFLMQKNRDPEVEKPIDKELARKIRNKLTIFRASLMEQKLQEVNSISRRRLNEILNPLYQVLMEVAPDFEDQFKLIVKELEQDREIEEEFTVEAEIVEAIVEHYNETKEITFSNAEIIDRLNKDKRERDQFSPQFIGRRLVSLGFKKKKLIKGKRGFCFKLNFLEKLVIQYRTKNIEPGGSLFDS